MTTARTGSIENGLIVLQGAIQTRVLPNGTVQTLTIAAHDISVPLPLGDSGEKFLSQAYNDPYAMDAKRLSDQIAFRKLTGTGGADLAGLEITLAQKYALPFASFIAVVIALPLAVRFGKRAAPSASRSRSWCSSSTTFSAPSVRRSERTARSRRGSPCGSRTSSWQPAAVT